MDIFTARCYPENLLVLERGNFSSSLTTGDHCHHHEILPVLGRSSWSHILTDNPANPLVTHPSSEAWGVCNLTITIKKYTGTLIFSVHLLLLHNEYWLNEMCLPYSGSVFA